MNFLDLIRFQKKNKAGAKTAARFAGGKLLGPVVEGGLVGFDVYNEAQTGGNPLRAAARGLTTMGTGTLGAAGAGALGIPTGPGAIAAGIGGYTAGSVAGGEIFDSVWPEQRKTPTKPGGYLGVGIDPTTGQPTLVTKAGPPLPTAASEKETGAWTINGWDPNAKRPTSQPPTSQPPISDTDRFTAKPPLSPTQADLPPSSEQVAPVDPYAYQLSVYGQGRQAAANQEAQKKVADLGLAINRTMYPQFSQESYNPLMAATFPERYQRTPEDFVVQNGVQSPRTMINNTDSEALRSETEENNIYKMDVALDEVLNNVLNQARLRQQGL